MCGWYASLVYNWAARWLDICGQYGITFNPDKFVFAQEFTGFKITSDTVRPCKRAITELPVPKNITDVRSWFGLLNQLEVACAFSMAEQMLSLRELLKPATPFHWDNKWTLTRIQNCYHCWDHWWGEDFWEKPNQHALPQIVALAFGCFRSIACVHQLTASVVIVDGWSPGWERFTHPAESRYAQTKGEALAVVDVLDKARHFV